MRKFLVLAIACGSVFCCAAQQATTDTESLRYVSVHANGTDIRDVLYQLFTQAGKSYVLQPGNHFALNLNLEKLEFEEALQVVCRAANLKADLQNGIYYVDKAPTKPKPPTLVHDLAYQSMATPIVNMRPSALFLPASTLSKKVTIQLHKAPLKTVLAELARQTHVRFELNPEVPAYKLDAVLEKATLRSALDQITQATGLTYALTDRKSIVIRARDAWTSSRVQPSSDRPKY